MSELISVLGQTAALLATVIAGIVAIGKVFDGQRCLLRSEMLKIYYKHSETKEIPQYELENFCMLYEAYKKLHGNSFIDKVAVDVKEWKVVK
jgi:hypothetical protein